MKILVTGGAGFIGSHLVDMLIAKGHRVVVVDNLTTGRRSNVNSEAELCEISLGHPCLLEVFTHHRPQVVFHLAAQIDVRKSVANPMDDAEQNIVGSLNLLESCVKAKVEKVIFSSTGGALYGEAQEMPTTETHKVRPLSPYGITKLAVENYLDYYHQIFGLPYVVLRYANVYGPRQNYLGEAAVISAFCVRLLQGQALTIYGEGNQTRDFVYVEDVVHANLQALDADRFDVYNIGTATQTSIKGLADLLQGLIGFTGAFNVAPPRMGEILHSCLSYTKAQTQLGWTPIVQLEEGLRRTVEWFQTETSK